MKDIIIPELAESILDGTISAWLVTEGDTVKEGDPIIELETDKIVVEVPAEFSGVIAEITKGDFEDVKVGEAVGKIDTQTAGSDKAPSAPPEKAEPKADPEPEKKKDSKPASPADSERPALPQASPAKRQADGPSLKAPASPDQASVQKEGQPAAGSTSPAREAESGTADRSAHTPNTNPRENAYNTRVERFTRRRQTIAANLVEAQQTMAMLTTFNEVDMSAIMALRKEVQEDFVAAHGVKLGLMSFFVKAAIGGLKQYPGLNAELRGDELILKDFYDIGIAVSTDQGLVVPVIRDCDKKSFAQIEADIQAAAEKARQGKLTLEDLQGGTFSITNGGIFGSTFSTPIINMPQAAILGMHNIRDRVVPDKDGKPVVRPVMQLALTYDHRIVDGKEAASFLNILSQYLTDPKKLLLEG